MTETKSMDRIIRILDDELTQLMDSGLYRQAEKTRYRLEVYMDMRNKAKELRGKLDDG
jgi:predicted nuclease with TOPRIM domain